MGRDAGEKAGTGLRVVVTGGGTGGHLFPGVAVAEALGCRFPGGEVLFIGTERQIDAKVLGDRSFQVTALRCGALKGKSPLTILRTLARMPLSLLRAMRVVGRFRPGLVFGVGGYVTGPVVLAARLLGIATCIHEQNSVPGLANRLLGRVVDRVFISLPGSEAYFPVGKTVLTGNPVRREILAAKQAGPVNTGHLTLLVLGGSQGAHRVNTLVVGALQQLTGRLPENFMVIHQTGQADAEMVRQAYADLGLTARVAPFFTDMAEVYQAADFVVSRAGATTLAEIAALEKPALLIPYPYAADDHQEKNGHYLVNGGGARMYLERELDAARLAAEIMELVQDPEQRRRMAEKMGRLAMPRATESIVQECLALLGYEEPAQKIA